MSVSPLQALDEKSAQASIENWLIQAVAAALGLTPNQIDKRKSFDSYGIDSSVSVGLSAELGRWLDRNLDPTILYDHQTIQGVARHLAHTARQPKAQ